MAAYTKIKKDDDMVMDKAGGADSYIFDPYNSVNKEITQEDVQAFLAKYNVHTPIHHFVLYKRAFVHRSYTKRPEA